MAAFVLLLAATVQASAPLSDRASPGPVPPQSETPQTRPPQPNDHTVCPPAPRSNHGAPSSPTRPLLLAHAAPTPRRPRLLAHAAPTPLPRRVTCLSFAPRITWSRAPSPTRSARPSRGPGSRGPSTRGLAPSPPRTSPLGCMSCPGAAIRPLWAGASFGCASGVSAPPPALRREVGPPPPPPAHPTPTFARQATARISQAHGALARRRLPQAVPQAPPLRAELLCRAMSFGSGTQLAAAAMARAYSANARLA